MLLAGVLAALLVAGLALRPTPPPRSGGAATFVELFLDAQFRSDALAEWTTLNPGQQVAIDRTVFFRCFAGPDESQRVRWTWTVLGTRSDPIDLEGVSAHTSTEVAVQATFRTAGSTTTRTFVKHAVRSGDDWTWILDPASYQALVAGHCPGTGGGSPTTDNHIT